MSKYLILIISAVCIFGGFILYHFMPSQSKSEDIRLVIEKFCNAVSKNDRKSLANYITETPSTYKKVYIDYGRNHMGDNFVENKEISGEISGSPKLFKDFSDFTNKDEAIDYIIPPLNLIIQQNRRLSNIVEIKQNENQARAIVNFGNEKFADISFEILLYNDGKSWKIFKLDDPNPYSEKYAINNF